MFGSVYYGVCIPQDLILDNDDKQIQTVFTDKLDAFKVIFSIIIFYILMLVIHCKVQCRKYLLLPDFLISVHLLNTYIEVKLIFKEGGYIGLFISLFFKVL